MTLIRLPAVLAEIGYRSPTTVYTAIREGLFPRPVALGARAKGWPAHEVQAINRARIAGQSEDQIKELVQQLHTKRLQLVEGEAA